MEEVKNTSEAAGVGVADQAADPAPKTNGDADSPDTVEVSDATEQLAAVTAERDQLSAEKVQLQDRFLRRQAEFDNFRKRVEREKVELLEFSGMEAMRAILPVADDFDRAIKMECADKEYARGMELIHQHLHEALTKLGLEAVETVGQKFDPNLHHAVTKEESPDHEDDTVLEEYQRGYNFKGRLLRPAMVKVSVRP